MGAIFSGIKELKPELLHVYKRTYLLPLFSTYITQDKEDTVSPTRHTQDMMSFVLLYCIYVIHVVPRDSFTHILQGYFTGTGAIVWLPQCLWSNPEEYG